MSGERRVALVTGANRGIGLEVCRQLAQHGYAVVLGSRDLQKGQAAARSLDLAEHVVAAMHLDVTNQASVDALAAAISERHGHLDVLVNNAAILYDTWQQAVDADLDVVLEAFQTNVFGAWRVSKAMIPLLHGSEHGRLVNVSSEGGSLARMGGGTPAYSASKAALNALTRMLAAELRRNNILVNSVCPGWVATDMGGTGGRPVAQGAASVMWAVMLPDDGPTGGFFRDGKPLAW